MNVEGFHVIVFFEAKPGKAADLARLLSGLVAPTLKEFGCREYRPFVDTENPNRFTVVEPWSSAEQWRRHLQTPHVANALGEAETKGILAHAFTAQQLSPV